MICLDFSLKQIHYQHISLPTASLTRVELTSYPLCQKEFILLRTRLFQVDLN